MTQKELHKQATPASSLYSPDNQNPYLRNDPSQSLSWFQRITDGLGITNNLGALNFQQQQNAAQWQSEYDLAMQDREYNSPAQQVARLREAGINPDIAGGVTPGDSSLAGNPAGANPAPVTAQNIAQNCSQVIGTVMSIASGLASIEDVFFKQDMSLMDTFLNASKEEMVGNTLSSYGPEKALRYIAGNIAHFDGEEKDSSVTLPFSTIENPFKTKRARKYAEDALSAYMANDRFKSDLLSSIKSRYSEVYDTYHKRGYLTATNKLVGSLGEGDKKANDLSEVFAILAGGVIQADYDESRSRSSIANYEGAFHDSLDPTKQGSALNAQADASKQSSELDQNQNSGLAKIFSNLAKASEEGNVWASIALIAYKAITSQQGISLGKSVFSGASAKNRR